MTTTIESIAPDTADVAIGGYSPVSYFENSRPERGDRAFSVKHADKTYHLTSAQQVETFRSNPDKYVPSFGAWCAYGMSMGENFPVDPTNFKIVDGSLMLFLRNDEVDARELWSKKDKSNAVEKATRSWESQ